MRERLLPLTLFVLAALISGCGESEPIAVQPEGTPETLAPMRQPSLEQMPELPGAEEIAKQSDAVADALENPKPPPWDGDADAYLLAWSEALLKRDADSNPLPQRWTARELVLGLA